MRRSPFALSVFAALCLNFGATALAADLNKAAPRTPAPPPPPAWNWSGFYVGGNVGYGFGHGAGSDSAVSPCPACAPLPGFASLAAASSNRADGVLGGLQAGYNWQITNFQVTNYLVGVETDFQGSAQKDTSTSAGVFSLPIFFFFGAQIPSPVIVANTTQLDWFGTVRGRLGLVNGGWLVYATGGLAYGELKSNSAVNPVTIAAGSPNVPFTLGNSTTKAGWVVGGGVENALSDHWSWKLEYLYMDLGNVSATGVVPAQGCLGNSLACNSTTPGLGRYSSSFSDSIVRIGLNYKWP